MRASQEPECRTKPHSTAEVVSRVRGHDIAVCPSEVWQGLMDRHTI